jgi:hypothetical protein
MPLYTNTSKGTVAYTSGTFFDQGKILANNSSPFASATLATVSDLSIPVAGYERVIGKYKIWYDGDDTTELKIRVANLAQSDGSTAVATTILTDVTARVAVVTGSNTPSAANQEGVGTYSTDGTGEIITIDVGASTAGVLLEVEFNAIITSATKGNIVFQAANIDGQSGAATHLMAGSHVVYKKW